MVPWDGHQVVLHPTAKNLAKLGGIEQDFS
jgi:hypothetical protein